MRGQAALFFSSLLLSMASVLPLARSQTIEFPEDELAQESVLPVFDKTVVVRNRAITTAGRFEIGGGLGLSLIEALYSNFVYGFNGAYHFDEIRGIQFQVLMQPEGLSSNGEKLKNGAAGVPFDPSRAPSPETFAMVNYQMTVYYGKISLTKQKSMNFSLFCLAGIGLVQFSDATEPALNVGFGQKFYFNPNMAFRFDLGLTMFQGPDPTSINLPPGPELSSSAFDSTLYFRSFLTAGLVFLL